MGDITKVEARVWAAEHGFRKVATKKDSIGVCFCPMDYRTFLKNWLAQNNEALAEEEQMMGENQALVGDWLVLVGSNEEGLSMKREILLPGMRVILFIPLDRDVAWAFI